MHTNPKFARAAYRRKLFAIGLTVAFYTGIGLAFWLGSTKDRVELLPEWAQEWWQDETTDDNEESITTLRP